MSTNAPHLQILINDIPQVDSVVESLDLHLDIDGNITLEAKQPERSADWASPHTP